jgi:hypothetical protein
MTKEGSAASLPRRLLFEAKPDIVIRISLDLGWRGIKKAFAAGGLT